MPDDLNPSDGLEEDVDRALREDIGSGDLTASLIPSARMARARVICREAAVICGRPWFDRVMLALSPLIELNWRVHEGEWVKPGQVLCELAGPAQAILSGERAALNFLQTLSGTATLARRYADAVAGTSAKVLDTRKTIPGLRKAQKYAAVCGGCHNHRMGLFDAILIKENHISAAGSIGAALEAARSLDAKVKIEVEVEGLGQLQEALDAGARFVLLDNFSLDDLRSAVKLNSGKAMLEASGNVNLDTVRAIAETGVDFISSGAITKDLRAIDLSMRFV